MIVYLDLNKWIEIAKIENGKDTSKRAQRIRFELNAAKSNGCFFPLSAIHYMEFSRISNIGRRKRLGKVMWEYSQGYTLIPPWELIDREIEVALNKYIPEIIPRTLVLLGNGIDFAFGITITKHLNQHLKDDFNRALLMGDEQLKIEPILSKNLNKNRLSFLNHLNDFHNKNKMLSDANVNIDNFLNAITMCDIIEPLNRILIKHNLNYDHITKILHDANNLIVNSMPTRCLDIHLHKQVLKNNEYKAKISDLEDWSGLGVASCYCDVVICEKHFADLLKRDNYSSKARIETDLCDFIHDII
ncbi:MAG: hypothetical protein ACFFC1_07560 [Promethearchaeota archaeon]